MTHSISCRELGMDCRFVAEGETEEVVMEALIRHANKEHCEDWYEIEEFYQEARSILRKTAA